MCYILSMDEFAALGDPVRREILALLGNRELSAGQIAERFAISRPAVSRHLRVLRESGLVTDEVEGRNRLYRLNDAALERIEQWVRAVRGARWTDALDALETEVYRTRRENRRKRSDPDRRSA